MVDTIDMNDQSQRRSGEIDPAPLPGRKAPPADAQPILDVRNLETHFLTDDGVVRAVDGVSFSLKAGETLGIVGESGSGKSVTALSLMRLLEDPARIVGGEIRFQGRDIVGMSEEELRQIRGNDIAMVFQDPMTSLNPVLRVAKQMNEMMVIHGRWDEAGAGKRSVSLLGRMGITAPERAVNSYPHQFSGGMRQRVVLAMGMSNEPKLLLADEPTTALDVTIQAQILDLLRELNRDFGTAIVMISHDLGVIAEVCTRVVVMYAGEVVEEGPTAEILDNPRHPYTWALINAVPHMDAPRTADRRLLTIEGAPPDPLNPPKGCRFAARCPFKEDICDEHPQLLDVAPGRKSRCWVAQRGDAFEKPDTKTVPAVAAQRLARAGTQKPVERGGTLLEVRGLVKHFALPKDSFFGERRVVHAVDCIDLTVARGETVGIVGESGCGKSSFARVVSRIYKPDSGTILFDGNDISTASPKAIRPLRRRMQMVFQDPYASLNPRMTVGEILSEPLAFHGITKSAKEARERVAELLDVVGLTPKAITRYPHEFSGGQRQRISIARALAVQPDLIIADEPISALDVNIQAQILNLMIDLQERFGLTYLVIAHDLAVMRHISDRIAVFYLGKVMEIAPAESLFAEPLHPYTKYLGSAVPDHDPHRRRQRLQLGGEPPSTISPPSGCRFRTRCPIAQSVCAEVSPPLVEHKPGQFAACHFPGQF